ncbi:MAG: DUF4136 domain-containing protein [Desulfobacteraceae bacterium]|nr:DUF4136 domain-containing protein [Desulfobacteraceae bacterium]MBC2756863.1 DUF4136 domain-containing protein [Desulfobacteraceae bacterium]
MKKNIIMAIVFGWVVFGCSSIKVSQDYNQSMDFSSLKTYAWKYEEQKQTGDVQLDSPLLDDRIRSAIDRSLSARGYRQDAEGNPDFYIEYHTTIQSRIESDNTRSGLSVGVGRATRYGSVAVSSDSGIREYDEGMLVIDLIDADSEVLIWRGVGSRRVTSQSKPEKITKNVNETVKKILDQFPPEKKN